jgi:hypothetical protein
LQWSGINCFAGDRITLNRVQGTVCFYGFPAISPCRCLAASVRSFMCPSVYNQDIIIFLHRRLSFLDILLIVAPLDSTMGKTFVAPTHEQA